MTYPQADASGAKQKHLAGVPCRRSRFRLERIALIDGENLVHMFQKQGQ